MFDVKETSSKVILSYLAASILLVSIINLVLFPSPVFDPIAAATGNLINSTLQANFPNILVFSLLIFGWGKLRPADVGLQWQKLAEGLSLTALLWLGTQALVLLIDLINGDIHIDPLWHERGVTTVLGGLLGQLLGNALFEEMQYRGFHLSQFYLKLRMQEGRWRLILALLAMLVLFILSHIPNRIFSGYSIAEIPLDFALLFIWGLFFSAIYLVSGNLFLAIGVHALVNRPTLITEASLPPQLILFFLTLILLAVRRRRQWHKKGNVVPVSYR